MPFRVAACLVCLTLPAAAQSDFVGHYAGRYGSYRWNATIAPGTGGSLNVKLTVSSSRPACQGELETTADRVGDTLVTKPPEKGDACKVVIVKKGRGILVTEESCMMWHGAACAFTSDMARQK